MKSQTVKTIGGVMSAVALISGGAGVAQAATVDSAAPAPAMPVVTAASDSAAPEAPGARTVEGSFSYDQDAVTANAEISGVFCKAAATLCASLPTYGCETAKAAAITVAGPGASFTATADELAGEAGDPCADGLRLERLTPNLSLPLPYGPRKPPPSGARLRAARILRPYCGPAERSSRVIERYPSLA